MEQAATNDTSREQIAARFMEIPPLPASILVLFHVLEAPHSRLNSEEEYDDDLYHQQADHKTQNAANAAVSKECDNQKGRQNRRPTAKRIANSCRPHANVRGKQLGDVSGKEERCLHVDGAHQ